jgi:hypothetical protein
MKNTGFLLILVGLALLSYSFSMEPYSNEEEFYKLYMAIDREVLGREKSSETFHSLRDTYLTNKYRFMDYGITLASLGLFLCLFFWNGWNRFKAPDRNWKIALIGFGAAFCTTAAYVGDLFTEFFRGSYPHWADSLGIPLSGIPVLGAIFLVWATVNVIGMNGKFIANASISKMVLKKLNIWYTLLSVVTVLIAITFVLEGYFWLFIPSVLWLYFYLAILAGRNAANNTLNTDAASGAG